MLTLKINQKDIEITESEEFVRGTVGAKCKVEFDSTTWSNTANTVVFKRYGIKPINVITSSLNPTLTIPHEVLSEIGSFKIGVFGTANGIVTPTLWSDEIKVRYGTDTNGTEPTPYTPSQVEQIETEIANKLNKKLDIKNDLNYAYDQIKLYASIDNNYNLVKANQSATENTIPVRDVNGSVNCKIAIKDSSGNNYTGAAAPHTWVNDRLNSLNETMYKLSGENQTLISNEANARAKKDSELQSQVNLKATINELQALTQIVNAKKITVYQIEANSYLELKTNSLYAFLKNDDSNKCSVGLADDVSGTNFEVFNSDTDDEITMKFGVVIMPENTMGSSLAYPPAYYGVAAIDKTVVVTTTVSSKKFKILKSDLDSGKHIVAKTDSNGTFMVWELKL